MVNDYVVLEANGTQVLSRQVMNMINEGYSLSGGVSVALSINEYGTTRLYLQAMVKVSVEDTRIGMPL